VIVFHPLNKEQIRQIVTLELNKVQKRLAEHNITLEVTEAARDYLAEKGYDPDYGARPLRRLVQSEVEDALSDALLLGTIRDNSRVRIDYQEGKLTFTTLETDGQVTDQQEVLAEPAA